MSIHDEHDTRESKVSSLFVAAAVVAAASMFCVQCFSSQSSYQAAGQKNLLSMSASPRCHRQQKNVVVFSELN